MEIKFTDSFWKSLKKLRYHNTWWYKLYEFFRRDIWWFIGNIYQFRKELYEHRPWDSSYSLSLLRRSIELLCDNIGKYGIEVDESRLKKIEKMRRAIEILKMHEEDSFLELAEKQMGVKYKLRKDIFNGSESTEDEKKTNMQISKLSFKIEKESFNELLEILKGQDYETFNKDFDFNTLFDGSGIKTWWD